MNFKYILLSLVLSISSFALAQTVTKVTPGQALVTNGKILLHVGDEVTFFDAQLAEAARGKVLRLTPNGTQALVKISSGKPRVGMSFEKADAASSADDATTHESSDGGSRGLQYSDLGPDDRRTLQRGEISDVQYIVGGIVATYPIGLGLGHAIQGRYSEKGWIFTVGELGSIAVLVAGIGDCADRWNYDTHNCSSALIGLGLFSYVGFRVWEAIDAWIIPPQQNQRYRELRARMAGNSIRFDPLVIPRPDGGALGLQVSF